MAPWGIVQKQQRVLWHRTWKQGEQSTEKKQHHSRRNVAGEIALP
jgi:hypothetical protein